MSFVLRSDFPWRMMGAYHSHHSPGPRLYCALSSLSAAQYTTRENDKNDFGIVRPSRIHYYGVSFFPCCSTNQLLSTSEGPPPSAFLCEEYCSLISVLPVPLICLFTHPQTCYPTATPISYRPFPLPIASTTSFGNCWPISSSELGKRLKRGLLSLRSPRNVHSYYTPSNIRDLLV